MTESSCDFSHGTRGDCTIGSMRDIRAQRVWAPVLAFLPRYMVSGLGPMCYPRSPITARLRRRAGHCHTHPIEPR